MDSFYGSLEESVITQEQIDSSVNEYLDKNPVKAQYLNVTEDGTLIMEEVI